MIQRILFVFMVLGPLGSIAQPQDKPQDNPKPSVLLIGDRVYEQFVVSGMRDELKDQAQVQAAAWPKDVLPNSTTLLRHLDLLLGIKDATGNELPEGERPVWDLIHFNVGLGDLVYCVPDLQSHRTLPHDQGGVVRTTAEQYEQNLDTAVRLLKEKAPGATLVWASTTPIRFSRDRQFKCGDEVAYNRIAERVMNTHGIPINDMHAYARSVMAMDKPGARSVDPFFFDGKPLHPPVVDTIVRELGLNPIDRTPEEATKK